jgi:transcriptional regulator of acetoin/glycerol metabolism
MDKNINRISNEAMNLLMRYNWPGNVRELRSTFEYAFVTCQGTAITENDLPPVIQQYRPTSNNTVHTPAPADKKERQKQELIQALKAAGGNQSRAAKILQVSRVTVWNRMKKYEISLASQLFSEIKDPQNSGLP